MNKKISTKTATIAIFVFFFSIHLTQAQVASPQNEQDKNNSKKEINLGNPSIINAKITDQSGGEIKVSFGLRNKQLVQPGIYYSFEILKKNGDLLESIYEKSYSELVTLGTDEVINREIEFLSPAYLQGEYLLRLKLVSAGGFVLDWSDLGQVNLSGTGDHLKIEPSGCSVFPANIPDKFKDTIPVFERSDGIVFKCKISNTFSENRTFFPKVDIRENFSEGKIIKSSNVSEIRVKAGGEYYFSYKISTSAYVQRQFLVFYLNNEKGELISNQIGMPLYFEGDQAAVINLRTEKDSYKKGESANIYVNLASLNFSSEKEAKQDKNIYLKVEMENEKGEACIEPAIREGVFPPYDAAKPILIQGLITNDCLSPKIKAGIEDEKGVVLDKKEFDFQKSINANADYQGDSVKKDGQEQKPSGFNKDKWGRIILILTGLVIFFRLVLWVVHKLKLRNYKFNILIFIFFSSLLLIPAARVNAGTYSNMLDGDTTLRIKTEYDSYKVGDKIKLIANVKVSPYSYFPKTVKVRVRDYNNNTSGDTWYTMFDQSFAPGSEGTFSFTLPSAIQFPMYTTTVTYVYFEAYVNNVLVVGRYNGGQIDFYLYEAGECGERNGQLLVDENMGLLEDLGWQALYCSAGNGPLFTNYPSQVSKRINWQCGGTDEHPETKANCQADVVYNAKCGPANNKHVCDKNVLFGDGGSYFYNNACNDGGWLRDNDIENLTNLGGLRDPYCGSCENNEVGPWTWKCKGVGGGTDSPQCTTASPTKAQCGVFNGTVQASIPRYSNKNDNVCVRTAATDVSPYSSIYEPDRWIWTCDYYIGFDDTGCDTDYCFALKVINSGCGTANGSTNRETEPSTPTELCASYNTSSVVITTETGWSWTCSGNIGAPASCSATKKLTPPPVFCGSANNQDYCTRPADSTLCSDGTTPSIDTSDPKKFKWTCGGTVSCSANKKCSADAVWKEIEPN
jgi:hypothetical protein